MKRSLIGSSDGTLAAGQAKRTKSSQACASCRRHKTRCELLGDVSLRANIKCHRCQVLGIECSFETSDSIHIIPQTSQASSTTLSRGPSTFNAGMTNFDTSSNVKVEDLIPSPNSVWRILNMPSNFDWVATPILAIQELLKLAPGARETPIHVDVHERLDTILRPDQISGLLEIFKTRYEPWLNAPTSLTAHSAPTPMLDVIRCQVASRDLDPTMHAVIAPRLQKLTEKIQLEELFNPPHSTEQIEALLIMSLWVPICDSVTNKGHDPRKFISTAIDIGGALGLPLEITTSARRRPHSRVVNLQIEENNFKARLWLLMSTLESLIFIGTGKPRVSRRSDADYTLIDVPVYGGLPAAREMRLGLIARLIDTTEKGCSLSLAGQDDIDNFSSEAAGILTKFDVLKRFIAPIPVISPFEAFQFYILLVQCHGCRLLVLHHALQEIRRVFPKSETEHLAKGLASTLTRDALACAQAVLTDTLAWRDQDQLVTVPDYIFWMISFAAAWIVTFNFSAYQAHHPSHVDAACDGLLKMTITRLSEISRSPNHTPAKCAHLISLLYGSLHRLIPELISGDKVSSPAGDNREIGSGDMAGSSSLPTDPYVSLPSMTTATPGRASSGSWSDQAYTAVPGTTNQVGETLGQDAFLSPEFWSSFMDNLPSSHP